MTDLNRSQFIARGAKGGLVLMAGLAIDFYGKAIASGLFKGDQLAYMTAARKNEQGPLRRPRGGPRVGCA